jgi:hypothetical protein
MQVENRYCTYAAKLADLVVVLATGIVSGGATAANGIAYHGGPVITGTTQIYYIWWVVL